MSNLLRHIAIIMDGNGRWAMQQNLPRISGHHHGAKTVDKIVTFARAQSIECLTLYAFSAQNWKRPKAEINALMTLLSSFLESQCKTMVDNGIRLRSIGRTTQLPKNVAKTLARIETQTSKNKDMILCLALSYGAKESITDALRSIADRVSHNEITAQDVDEELISRSLETSMLPPVDLLIRTGKECRISNFLLWESAYAEFVYSDKMWPDFTPKDLQQAINIFMSRERRFGDIDGSRVENNVTKKSKEGPHV